MEYLNLLVINTCLLQTASCDEETKLHVNPTDCSAERTTGLPLLASVLS